MSHTTEHELLAQRKRKLEALRAMGIDPFGGKFAGTESSQSILAQFKEGRNARFAGRVVSHRDMGGSQFMHLQDQTGKLQVYFQRKAFDERQNSIFDQIDLGDFIGVDGTLFTTKTGEHSIRVEQLTFLSKAIRPLPDKWHGLSDVEARYRQRYLDLIARPEIKELFIQRSFIVSEIRRFFEERGFIEFETPMMQQVAGGTIARPFKTHHNALGIDIYLRVALELYLKRLLVGGFEKIFEMNRNFRNEGISRKHNPEFTMLEAYWAYADFEMIADLVEELITHLAMKLHGSLLVPRHPAADGSPQSPINLTRPWKRRRYYDCIYDAVGADWQSLPLEAKRKRAKEHGVLIRSEMIDFEITQEVFEKLVEAKTVDPLYVTHLPHELIVLAKQNQQDSSLIDVYELIINGQEISPGYTELNDPIVQRARLEAQVGEEIQAMDEDFLTALEHGMPPAGGFGLGIDRLVMMLTGAESIRDVILFPLLKPKQS